jgi:hypothetical protein
MKSGEIGLIIFCVDDLRVKHSTKSTDEMIKQNGAFKQEAVRIALSAAKPAQVQIVSAPLISRGQAQTGPDTISGT